MSDSPGIDTQSYDLIRALVLATEPTHDYDETFELSEALVKLIRAVVYDCIGASRTAGGAS